MQITDALIDKLAALSKLQFPDEEREAIKADFERMLHFVDKLQEVDTSGVEPLIHVTEEVNHLRQDIPQGQLTTEETLHNAPDHDGQHFRVPKVVKK
ncbi:MAG: Asp-tRNA(Asn)/Glu-tRNA(Gln) amidotransferase subunit GatC [Bacteroidota bacterium]